MKNENAELEPDGCREVRERYCFRLSTVHVNISIRFSVVELG